MEKKAISIGIEDYKRIIDKNYYYIDKTLLIKELLDKGVSVNLFTRPRRFGKTLALSMLKTFFEKEISETGELIDNSRYFVGTRIMEAGEKYVMHREQYPVISLSLKSAKQPDYDMAYQCMIDDISREFIRHRYVTGVLLEDDKERFERLMSRKAEKAEYATSLKFLSDCLKRFHGKNTIILIDEYDVPLENAYMQNFYEQMIQFIRSLFESAFKTNGSLEFAVITGCLRISRESIFTGLNNLKTISVLDSSYAECFGFTEKEVEKMLSDYDISGRLEEVRQWYDGYLFGDTEVYNPWSVINYVEDAQHQKNVFPKPYWSNTSSNSIVRELIENADIHVKREIEGLIAGGTIEKAVHEDITYEDVYKTQENLWNFLFFTGYLKAVKQRFDVDTVYLTMMIPNEEIRYIYRNSIMEWFGSRLKMTDFTPLYKAFAAGDCEVIENVIKAQLKSSISFYDSAEKFYHGFMLGILGAIQDYEIVSNRESGDGRADIILKPLDEQQPAIIIELKCVKSFTEMDTMCDAALRQIEDKHYNSELIMEGYLNIRKYGICFCRKSCRVKM
jgi:hypothetical protein